MKGELVHGLPVGIKDEFFSKTKKEEGQKGSFPRDGSKKIFHLRVSIGNREAIEAKKN